MFLNKSQYITYQRLINISYSIKHYFQLNHYKMQKDAFLKQNVIYYFNNLLMIFLLNDRRSMTYSVMFTDFVQKNYLNFILRVFFKN